MMSASAAPRAPRRPNSVLIDHRVRRGLGRGALARTFMRIAQQDNLPLAATAESVQKQIYRVETGQIEDPEPLYQMLWCKAFDSDLVELFGHLEPDRSGVPYFDVSSDKFIPAYIGPDAVGQLAGAAAGSGDHWLESRKMEITDSAGDCDLYLFPFGVALLHLRESLQFPNIASLAVWRRQTQRDTRAWGTERLQKLTSTTAEVPYVLSTYWLDTPIWSAPELDTALKLISLPCVLLDREPDDPVQENPASLLSAGELVERSLLKEGFEQPDLVNFGVRGVSVGYASWSGISYFQLAPKRSLVRSELCACEVSVQAIWCYCHYLLSQLEQRADLSVPEEYGWRFLRAAKSRLTTERPRETGQHRSMRLAILQTSGLSRQLEAALEAVREGM